MASYFPKELLVVFSVFSAFHLMIFGYIKFFILFLIPRRFKPKKNISGQTVLITGAGSGMGRQLAIEFSKHSVCLVLLDLNRSSMFDTEKLLDRSSRTFVYDCDVSDRQKVYEVAKVIAEEVGKVDILVNNAGIVYGKSFLDTPDEEIQKTVEVNMLAHFWVRLILFLYGNVWPCSFEIKIYVTYVIVKDRNLENVDIHHQCMVSIKFAGRRIWYC